MRIFFLVISVMVLGGIAWKVVAKERPDGFIQVAATAGTPSSSDPLYTDRELGSASAPVTILEYSSLTCPHCADFDQEILPRLKKDYIDTGKVRLISRDFPLDPPSLKAAMMARCAPPERYFALIDLLFKGQKEWGLASDYTAAMMPLGKFSGMSEKEIKSCLDNTTLQDYIVSERKGAEDNFKVNSTPTFIFNGGAVQFSGTQSYDKFTSTIESLSAKK